jgi:hypothetical protein
MMNALLNLNDAVGAGTERLGDKFRDFLPVWERALKSNCHQDGQWSGDLDGPLKKLLKHIDHLIEWWNEHHPKHRDGVVTFFRRNDPAATSLPEILEHERAQRWIDLRKYFIDTAHRNRIPDEPDFQKHLTELEQMLVDSLYRSPSVDFSNIDAILREETPDA